MAGNNPYPVAPPGTSAHEAGYAFDMIVVSTNMKRDLADLGAVWKSWGGIWGGEFNDPIHFEFPGFPHAAANKSFTDNPPDWWVTVANTAAGFLPGPAGILASVGTVFQAGKPKCPWYDPFGFITNCQS